MSENNKNNFVFFASFLDSINCLEDSQQLEVYKAISNYGVFGIETELSPVAKAIFLSIKPNLNSSLKRYNACVENGKKGGNPNLKKGEPNPYYNQKTTKQDNQKDNQQNAQKITQDNLDKDMDKDKEKEKDIDKETELFSKQKIWFNNSFNIYPRKDNRVTAFNIFCNKVKTKEYAQQVYQQVKQYVLDEEDTEITYIKYFDNWLLANIEDEV